LNVWVKMEYLETKNQYDSTTEIQLSNSQNKFQIPTCHVADCAGLVKYMAHFMDIGPGQHVYTVACVPETLSLPRICQEVEKEVGGVIKNFLLIRSYCNFILEFYRQSRHATIMEDLPLMENLRTRFFPPYRCSLPAPYSMVQYPLIGRAVWCCPQANSC
jgi:hypothetical protein